MGSNYIILIRMPRGAVVALMTEELEHICVFRSEQDAEKEAEQHELCRAFPYQIVRLEI